MSFPVKLEILFVFFTPVERTLPAGLLPGSVLGLLVLEIMRVLPAPLGHIVKLAFILALHA